MALFQPGQSGNPKGRPPGSKNKLQEDFLKALVEDFGVGGKEAIVQCRLEKPDAYLKVIASLMPKELEISHPADGLSDDELAAVLAHIDERLAGRTGEAASDSGEAPGGQPAQGLQTLQ